MREQSENEHHYRGNPNGGINGLANTIGAAPAEVLPNHGRNGEGQGHHRQEERLHHARAYSEPGLGGWSEAPNDSVNNRNIYKEQHELNAGRHADLQHFSPDLCLWAEQRETETQVTIFFFEIDHHEDIRNQDGDETGERRAGYAQSGPGADSEYQ